MYLSAVERGDTESVLEMLKESAKGAKIWQDFRKIDVCEEVFPADTWGEDFLRELSASLDGDETLGPAVVVHWEDIKPWKNVASSGSLHSPGQVESMSEALRSSGNLPPVLRRWRGSHGEDAVDCQEEPGDFPYFVDGKHRVQAALQAGVSRVPVIDLLQFEGPAADLITRNKKGEVIPLSERFGKHQTPGSSSDIEGNRQGGPMGNQYKFVNECVGGGYGQTDMELGLWIKEGPDFDPVGYISYAVSNNEPAIKHIEVLPAKRRKGYATKLVLELQNKYPDVQLHWGVSTAEGDALYQSLPKKKVALPGIVEAHQLLWDVRNKLSEYQNKYEQLQQNLLDDQEMKAFMDNTKDWNELHDKEEELSIYETMADHKIVFDTSSCDPGPEKKVSVCIWPDGMVCRQQDIESYNWASDDYTQVEIPIDEDMYDFAHKFIENQMPDYSPGPR